MFETLDLTKTYEEQSPKAKEMISKKDFYEVVKVLCFKQEIKKQRAARG